MRRAADPAPALPRGAAPRHLGRMPRAAPPDAMPDRDTDRAHMQAALGPRRGALAMPGRTRRWAACWSTHGRVIGRGWTQPGGRPHAETEALRRAGPAGPRRHRLCHAGALFPPRPHAALLRCADPPPASPAWSSPCATPTPRDGRGVTLLRDAGIDGRGRPAAKPRPAP